MNFDIVDNDQDNEFFSFQLGISGIDDDDPEYPMHEYMALSYQNLSAAQSLKKDEHLNVILALLSSSIELSLKAFLFKKGISKTDLAIKYGHSANKLIEESKNNGLSLDENDKIMEYLFSDYDEDKKKRESLLAISEEKKKNLKEKNINELTELFNEGTINYNGLMVLAYICDHEGAKKEINSKKYKNMRKPKSKIMDFRYKICFLAPNINKSIKFVEKIYKMVDEKI